VSQQTKHGASTRPDRSIPAETDADGGVEQPAQPGTDEQSGSTGRRVADGNPPPGQDSGQGRYGQSGFAGTPHETIGQANYRRSGALGDQPRKKSNRGSGQRDPEPQQSPSHSDQETVGPDSNESGPKTT
jgi:hypothetical protein